MLRLGVIPGLVARCRGTNAGRQLCSVADEIVAYVRTGCQDTQQRLDVVRSGLASFPIASSEGRRLMLEAARVQAEARDWGAAQQACSDILDAPPDANSSSSDVAAHLAAGHLLVNTSLMLGRDSEAEAACERVILQASTTAEVKHVAAAVPRALRLAVEHAQGRPSAAHLPAGMLKASLDACPPGPSGVGDAFLAAAGKVLGDYHQALGQADAATAAYDAAAGRAAQARSAAEASPSSVVPASFCSEVAADIMAAQAQAHMRGENWDVAEEQLGQALKGLEDALSPNHPTLALILTLLGHLFSRTARVTYAEGLYREAAKILSLDPSSSHPPASCTPAVHHSSAALLCWRYHQLLTVLPRRGAEAGRWGDLAEEMWQGAGPCGGRALGLLLGSADVLSGKGSQGAGVLVSLAPRRLLPLGAE